MYEGTPSNGPQDLGALARAALDQAEHDGKLRFHDHWSWSGRYTHLRDVPDAGSWNDEDLYDYDRDVCVRSRLHVECPHCGRTHRPLLSPTIATIEFGWRWVGLDHREPYSEKVARCPRTRRWYRFTTYTPQ